MMWPKGYEQNQSGYHQMFNEQDLQQYPPPPPPPPPGPQYPSFFSHYVSPKTQHGGIIEPHRSDLNYATTVS